MDVALSIAGIELGLDVFWGGDVFGRVGGSSTSDGWRNTLADLDKVDSIDVKPADGLVEKLELKVLRWVAILDISTGLVIIDFHVENLGLGETVST